MVVLVIMPYGIRDLHEKLLHLFVSRAEKVMKITNNKRSLKVGNKYNTKCNWGNSKQTLIDG